MKREEVNKKLNYSIPSGYFECGFIHDLSVIGPINGKYFFSDLGDCQTFEVPIEEVEYALVTEVIDQFILENLEELKRRSRIHQQKMQSNL